MATPTIVTTTKGTNSAATANSRRRASVLRRLRAPTGFVSTPPWSAGEMLTDPYRAARPAARSARLHLSATRRPAPLAGGTARLGRLTEG